MIENKLDEPIMGGARRKWLGRMSPAWLTERWFAWNASRKMLALYRRIHRENPRLTGKMLYERVLVCRSGLDAHAAAEVLRRAEQSFCEWPSERDLKFREVVQYLVIAEYLRSRADKLGTNTNMEKMVMWVIPKDL